MKLTPPTAGCSSGCSPTKARPQIDHGQLEETADGRVVVRPTVPKATHGRQPGRGSALNRVSSINQPLDWLHECVSPHVSPCLYCAVMCRRTLVSMLSLIARSEHEQRHSVARRCHVLMAAAGQAQ